MAIISNISKAADLETTHEQTRKGFIDAAMEKNRRAQPFIENAKTLRNYALQAGSPYDLLTITEIQKPLLVAVIEEVLHVGRQSFKRRKVLVV